MTAIGCQSLPTALEQRDRIRRKEQLLSPNRENTVAKLTDSQLIVLSAVAARDEVASLGGARHLDRTVSARHAGL